MAHHKPRNLHGLRPRALVTGASTGIGAAFAERLARDGYDLVIVARDRGRLERLANTLRETERVEIEVLPADLTEPTELSIVERGIADAELAMLVNNAGFGTYGAFHDLPVDREQSEIQLNVLALMRLTRAALPGMLERHDGSIINVSSLAAMQPAPYNATYGATKAFVNSFTEALHAELRDTGVRVQALCPGFTRTEFQARAGIDISRVPAMAWMTAEEVVATSLAALPAGPVVCIPGMANRVLSSLNAVVPRSIASRIAARLLKPAPESSKPRRGTRN